MGLYKRGKSWYIDYRVEGRRVRESIGPNRKVAERALAKRKVQVAENRILDVVARPKTGFEQLCKAYMEYAKVNKRSWSRDDLSIRTLGRWFAGMKLAEITALAIEKYKNDRSHEVKPATINRELACLKHMFNKAIQWGMARTNPVRSVKMLRENNRRLRYLTEEEAQRLVDECADHIKPIVVTALYTGMRSGEILNLKWEDVDLGHGLIYIQNSKSGSREVPISTRIVELLRELHRRSQYVFACESGRPRRGVRKGFESALRRAGIRDFTFHDLRHTFASHLVMSGVDLLTVKELMGHRSINMTLRYAHLSPSHKRQAVESLSFLSDDFPVRASGSPKLMKQSRQSERASP